jgi:DNA-binding transcriptional regulator GbsR (MarR family)
MFFLSQNSDLIQVRQAQREETMTRIIKHNLSNWEPIFIKAKQIINQENTYSIEEIVKTIDELSEYEKDIINIRQTIIEATYTDIISKLIEPVDELFEAEYETNK